MNTLGKVINAMHMESLLCGTHPNATIEAMQKEKT